MSINPASNNELREYIVKRVAQELRDGEGGYGGHEHHHHAAHDAGHGKRERNFGEHLQGSGP